MVATRELHYEHDGLRMTGLLALPDRPGPHPGVLVMHSALGIDDDTCRRACDLAALGYVALAADMYGLGPGLAREQVGQPFLELQANPELVRARTIATYDAVCAVPEVDARRVAAIGYCFGGQCALELVRSGADVWAAVSFHGLLRTAMPARRGVSAKVLSITGAKDPNIPAADLEAFQREMTDAGADWHVTVYGEGEHGFAMSNIGAHEVGGAAYDPVLDGLSWNQAIAFLAATLPGAGAR